ncbi:hypothetical protein BGX33_002211, partial [Mortierella sp. NVP41]
AGQPATVSWTNSCNEVVGNTTFPIYIQGPPVGVIPDAIGYLDCKMPGKSNVMIPATLPQGNEYWIWAMTRNITSSSVYFTILASIPGSTTTISSTSILPTTADILTTTNSPNPTGSSPAASNEGDDIKGNGAVIGGGTAAAVVAVIAAVALLYFRRLRRQQPQQKVTSESQHAKSLKQRPTHNIQYIPMGTSQDRPSDPQGQICQLQKENVHSQFGHFNNPQLIPADAQGQPFTTRRSPQGIHAPIPKDNNQDMQQQIHKLQTELNRLQARLNTEN